MGQLSLLSFSIPFLEIPIKCPFPTTVHLFLLPFYSLFHLFFLWQQPLLSLSCRTQARRKERTHECIPHGASPPSSTLPQVPSRLLWYTGGFKDLGKRRALYGRTLADYQLKEEKSTCLFVTTTVRHDARKTHKVAKQEKRNKRILPPLQVVQSCALSAVLGAHAVHIDLSRWRRTDRATLGRVVTPSPSRRDQDHTSQAGSASTLQNRVTYHEPFAGRLPLRGERQTAEPVSSTHPKAERKSADTNYTCKHERKQILEHIHRRKRSLTVNSIQKQSDKCKI